MILMSTHNKGFYRELTKIIVQLLSNIIKYPPYLFFWYQLPDKQFQDWEIPASVSNWKNTTGYVIPLDKTGEEGGLKDVSCSFTS